MSATVTDRRDALEEFVVRDALMRRSFSTAARRSRDHAARLAA